MLVFLLTLSKYIVTGKLLLKTQVDIFFLVENGVFCFNFERILYISQVSVLLPLLEGSSEFANLFRFLIVIHDSPSIYGTQAELVQRPNPFHNRLQVYCCPHESFHRLKLLLRSKFSKKKMRTEK